MLRLTSNLHGKRCSDDCQVVETPWRHARVLVNNARPDTVSLLKYFGLVIRLVQFADHAICFRLRSQPYDEPTCEGVGKVFPSKSRVNMALPRIKECHVLWQLHNIPRECSLQRTSSLRSKLEIAEVVRCGFSGHFSWEAVKYDALSGG